MSSISKHPCNVVRLILNRMSPATTTRSTTATPGPSASCKNWHREGVLFTEADPAIYVYHQEFTAAGPHVHAPRLHGPHAAVALRRRPGLPARRNLVGPEDRPADAHHHLQGEPEPGLRAVSRPGRRGSATCWTGRRRHDAAGGHRSPGRDEPHLAGDRRGADHRRGRPSWGPSRCSSPTAITATRRPATTATTAAQAAAHARASGQFRADDVRGHGRPGPAGAAHAPAVPRPAGA